MTLVQVGVIWKGLMSTHPKYVGSISYDSDVMAIDV